MQKIRVYLVDDSIQARLWLAKCVESNPKKDIVMVGSAVRNEPNLLDEIIEMKAQIVIVDLVLKPRGVPVDVLRDPDSHGPGIIEQIKLRTGGRVKVIAWTNFDHQLEKLAKEKGADIFIFKEQPVEEIRRYIRDLASSNKVEVPRFGDITDLDIFPEDMTIVARSNEKSSERMPLSRLEFTVVQYLANERLRGNGLLLARNGGDFDITASDLWLQIGGSDYKGKLPSSTLAKVRCEVNGLVRAEIGGNPELIVGPGGGRKGKGTYRLIPALTAESIHIHRRAVVDL